MEHKFKTIKPPDYILFQSGFIPSGTSKICENCNLIVHRVDHRVDHTENVYSNDGDDHSDYFYLNEREIYHTIIILEDLHLTCGEIIIKNIIE